MRHGSNLSRTNFRLFKKCQDVSSSSRCCKNFVTLNIFSWYCSKHVFSSLFDKTSPLDRSKGGSALRSGAFRSSKRRSKRSKEQKLSPQKNKKEFIEKRCWALLLHLWTYRRIDLWNPMDVSASLILYRFLLNRWRFPLRRCIRHRRCCKAGALWQSMTWRSRLDATRSDSFRGFVWRSWVFDWCLDHESQIGNGWTQWTCHHLCHLWFVSWCFWTCGCEALDIFSAWGSPFLLKSCKGNSSVTVTWNEAKGWDAKFSSLRLARC